MRCRDEIAVAVATALKVALLGDSELTSALGARDPEAYNLCLQGRYFSNKLTPAALATAVEYYRQALAIDPDLALAWAGLADALANQTGFGEGGDFAAGFSEARRAAQRGLDLDPRLPEAHAALGDVQLSSDWDWTGAEQSYRRALASRPGDPDIRRRLAGLLTIQGRFAEATRELDQVIAKDPLYWRAYVDRINSSVAGGELERAEAMALEFVRVQPDFPFGHGTLGGIYYLQGRYAEALDQFALESYSFFSLMGLSTAHFALGNEREADSALGALIAEHGDNASYQIAVIYAQRGDAGQALSWLERGLAVRDPGLVGVKYEPLFEPLRDEPRFQALLGEMGFAQ